MRWMLGFLAAGALAGALGCGGDDGGDGGGGQRSAAFKRKLAARSDPLRRTS